MIAKFFPRSQYPVSVCKHRRGKDFTFSSCTDTVQTSARYTVEYYCFKNNFRSGVYIGKHIVGDNQDIPSCELSGALRFDLYFNRTGSSLPTDPERIAEAIDWFKRMLNRAPSAVSFALGVNYSPWTIDFFLSGRNSNTGVYNYGKLGADFLGSPQQDYTRTYYANRPSSIRWSDGTGGLTPGAGLFGNLTWAQVDEIVELAANTEGWMQNFTHWHDLKDGKSPIPANIVYMQEQFHNTVKDKVASLGKTVHLCSPGEAVEYMVFRQLITRLACYTPKMYPQRVRIAIEVDSLFLQQCINTPISVTVDLSDSYLAGKPVKCDNCDMINLGDDQYIVEIPLRIDQANNKTLSVELVEGVHDYLSETPPVVSVTKGTTSATITTNVPTRLVLFRKVKGAAEDTFTKFGSRLNDLSTAKTITGLNFTTHDYSVGVSSKHQILNASEIF